MREYDLITMAETNQANYKKYRDGSKTLFIKITYPSDAAVIS